MGGDKAPGINIRGALLALEEAQDLHIVLVGDSLLLKRELGTYQRQLTDRLSVVHAEQVIQMEDHAVSAIRNKKRSSIHVGLDLVRNHAADAFISAGNSGAVMAGALLILKRLKGVERPAILIKMPTAEGYSILLDAGANVDCSAEHLVQFARMGHIYAEVIEGIKRPKIALVSNASETHKGSKVTRAAHTLLKERRRLNYIGYAEGFDLFRGTADVIVCDGFVGNVILKTVEGLAETCFEWFKKEIRRDVLGLVGIVFMMRLLRKFKKKFDYQPYGAAPLLGINGMVLLSHGSSTDIAIRNGILTARRGVEQHFVSRIQTYLEAEPST